VSFFRCDDPCGTQKCHLGALPIVLNRKVRERPKMVKSKQMWSTVSFDENGKA